MEEWEEYLQTGMLGGYKPELIRGTEACGKIIPHYGDEVGVCSEEGAVGLTHNLIVDSKTFPLFFIKGYPVCVVLRFSNAF